jgi:uncharacterized membrane protein YgcG
MFVVLGALAPFPAWASDWVVSKVSQPSSYSPDGKTWSAVTKGMTVSNKSWIATGPRGRVVLERRKDKVTFQPDTLASITEKQGFAVHTEFAQQTGELQLSIDPKVKPHLSVQTPYLAAVVKGTVFSVSVNAKGAAVGVTRGRVEVTDAVSGEQAGVKAGQLASVDTDPSTSMSLSGTNTDFDPIMNVQPFNPKVNAPATPATFSKKSAQAASTDDGAAQGPNNSNGQGSGNSGGSSGKGGNNGKSGNGGDSGGNGNSGKGSENGGGKGHDKGGKPGKGDKPGKPGKGHKPDKGDHHHPHGGHGDSDKGGKPGKGHHGHGGHKNEGKGGQR